MGRSRETFGKKEVRNKKEKKRKEKEKKRLARKEKEKSGELDDMIAYVDEEGNITSTPPEPGEKKETKLEDIEISTPKKDEMDEEDPVHRGKLIFFDTSKGYGFIRDKATSEKVFTHVNHFMDDIEEGQSVSFEVEMGQKGPIATRVQLVK
jgi:cold shock CspA family protein